MSKFQSVLRGVIVQYKKCMKRHVNFMGYAISCSFFINAYNYESGGTCKRSCDCGSRGELFVFPRCMPDVFPCINI